MTQQLDASQRAIVVVYDPQTGNIRQVVHCSRQDAEAQHLPWPGHLSLDVTTTCPEAHPELHRVCLETRKLLLR